MYCPNCNAEVSEAQSFCMNCGTPLKPQHQQPQQPAYSEQPEAYSYDSQPAQAPQPDYGQSSSPQPPYNYDAYASSQGADGQPYGQSPLPPNGYVQPQAPSNTAFGLAIAALVCTVLGITLVGFVLAIVSLVLNSKQKKSGILTTKQTPTFVMDIISIVLSVIMTILLIIFGFVLVAAVESGEFDNLGVNVTSSGSATISTPSGTSVTIGKDSSSSSAAPAVSASSNASKDVLGNWEIYEVVGNDSSNSVGPDDINLMKERGINVGISFNSDNTFAIDMLGENVTGTWTMSGSIVTIMVDGESTNLTLNGDELIMEEDADKVIFHRA